MIRNMGRGRSLGLILAVVMIVLALTGCQGDGKSAGNDNTNDGSKPVASVNSSTDGSSNTDTHGANVSGSEDAQDQKGTVLVDDLEGRRIFMYLPPGYDASEERYPVVYMNDGQNVFDVSTSGYGMEWMVDEVLDEWISKGQMEKVIVAAVAHGDSMRSYEYVPFVDPYAPSDGTSAEEFTKYFIEKVIPYVDGKYRTVVDRDHRMIMGSSFGGIQALWMGYNHPEVFSAIGVVSPATWAGNMKLFDVMRELTAKPDMDIWLDMGELEGMPIEPLVAILQDKGFEHGKDLYYMFAPEAEHNEIWWSKRVHSPLLMFGGQEAKQVTSIEVTDHISTVDEPDGKIRINPIITMDNGISFSGNHVTSYKVLNPDAGSIDAGGVVTFLKSEPLEVEITYQGVTVKHTVENK